MCINVYEFDSAICFSAPGVAWNAALKKTKVKLDSFNWYRYVINAGKGIRGGICHSIFRYAKANNKYMKDYNMKES